MASRKLVLVGGGGVRGPLFVEAAARRADTLGLDQIVLVDTDEAKLRLLGAVSRHVAAEHGGLRVVASSNPRSSFEGADFVVTTIRVGGEQSRIRDERVALAHGILGQETTGPAGFGMALRSIPAILDYAGLLAETSPDAWMFNFTNPAGLVTQALRDAGHERAVGICDGANSAQHAVAEHTGHDANALRPEVYGLNHLSWTRALRTTDGTDLLAPLLHDTTFRAKTLQRFFPPELVDMVGTWINEYLYYYYFAEQAVERIKAEPRTRGEEVRARNAELITRLNAIDIEENPAETLTIYRAYEDGRRSTYMQYAEPDPVVCAGSGDRVLGEGSEGYAGVALDLMEALTGGAPRYTAVNVPNADAIDGMAPDDVVEVSTVVDTDGVRTMPIGSVPRPQFALMQSVKTYERRAAQAIRARSRQQSVAALMAHPLVMSYSRATALADDYLRVNADHIGQW